MRNAPRRAKSVLFGFLIIPEGNKGGNTFDGFYRRVIRVKRLLGNPMRSELFVLAKPALVRFWKEGRFAFGGTDVFPTGDGSRGVASRNSLLACGDITIVVEGRYP